MTISVTTSQGGYDITVQRGGIHTAGEYFPLDRKALIVTDSGVPEQYVMTVASQCDEAVVFVFEQGEPSKTMDTYAGILKALTENGFTRTDCIVAVGGGVVGDMAGFAAATYMRGIDFYNIPTTLLSQVDSSIGGKTAVDFMGYKNLVGAFYPPRGVLIDPQVLQTLSPRHIANGMAEVIKMAATCDEELFGLLETAELSESVLDEVIIRALRIKQQVVVADERESGLRRVLNYGHTLGHAIECITTPSLFHGECVALGMMPMCVPSVRDRLKRTLERWGLPTELPCKSEQLIQVCRHDKKTAGDTISVILVPRIGHYDIKLMSFAEFEDLVREVTQR